MKKNIVNQPFSVVKTDRQRLNGHASLVIWLTGLSGAGKSTLANELDKKLYEQGVRSYVLDGDNLRNGLTADLGFSDEDRKENIRRVGEVAKLFVDAGVVVIAAFVSPFRADRELVRKLISPDQFIEVFVDTPLETCERRDTKGLYAKARAGEIKDLTGVSSPYERPLSADVVINTSEMSSSDAVNILLSKVNIKMTHDE